HIDHGRATEHCPADRLDLPGSCLRLLDPPARVARPARDHPDVSLVAPRVHQHLRRRVPLLGHDQLVRVPQHIVLPGRAVADAHRHCPALLTARRHLGARKRRRRPPRRPRLGQPAGARLRCRQRRRPAAVCRAGPGLVLLARRIPRHVRRHAVRRRAVQRVQPGRDARLPRGRPDHRRRRRQRRRPARQLCRAGRHRRRHDRRRAGLGRLGRGRAEGPPRRLLDVLRCRHRVLRGRHFWAAKDGQGWREEGL
ncbi:hypothetical protein HK405_001709, partial [Cladochytrium tenue]